MRGTLKAIMCKEDPWSLGQLKSDLCTSILSYDDRGLRIVQIDPSILIPFNGHVLMLCT